MKQLPLHVLSLLVLSLPLVAHSHDQPDVSPVLCGITNSFPMATEVCIMKVKGAKRLYLSTSSFNKEAPPSPGGDRYRSFGLMTSVFSDKKRKTTIYKAYEVGITGSLEQAREWSHKLILDESSNPPTAQLIVDGQTVQGGDEIEMAPPPKF